MRVAQPNDMPVVTATWPRKLNLCDWLEAMWGRLVQRFTRITYQPVTQE